MLNDIHNDDEEDAANRRAGRLKKERKRGRVDERQQGDVIDFCSLLCFLYLCNHAAMLIQIYLHARQRKRGRYMHAEMERFIKKEVEKRAKDCEKYIKTEEENGVIMG